MEHNPEVSATEMVRNFSKWQDHALREPVHVLHHGRRKLTLVSTDFLAKLNRVREDDAATAAEREILLDAVPFAAVLVDQDCAVTYMNHAARSRFNVSLQAAGGSPLPRLLSDGEGTAICDMVRRVCSSRSNERIDVLLKNAPFSAIAVAFSDGALLFLQNTAAAEERDHLQAEITAISRVLAQSGNAALARINARGYVDVLGPDLAALARIAEAAVPLRFVNLFDVADRPALGGAIEAAFIGQSEWSSGATLLVGGMDMCDVTVTFAPIHGRTGVSAVQALVSRRATPN